MSEETTSRTNQEQIDEDGPVKAFYGRDKKAEEQTTHKPEFPKEVSVKAKVNETGQDGRTKSVSRQFKISGSQFKNGEWHYQLKDSNGKLHGGGALVKESELSWALQK